MEPLRPTEEGRSPDISEQHFNDLVYSLETKTFYQFRAQLVANNIFSATLEWTDPLPQFSFDEISEELKKRLAKLSKHKLQDTKIWLRDPWKRIVQIIESEQKRIAKNAGEMSRSEVVEKEKKFEQLLSDLTHQKNKFEELIRTVEQIEQERETRTKTQKSTKNRFEQLHLFEDNNNADTR